MKNIITDYGAVPGTDCTAAFQAAAKIGGVIEVPAGTYNITGTADACIIATRSCRFVGEGWPLSQIIYTAPAGVDCFTFRPDPVLYCDGSGIEDIWIQPASGGRYAVRVDLTATGALMRSFRLKGAYLWSATGADAAFKLDNPTNLNGFFCTTLGPDVIFHGGAKLLGCGDSVSILGSIMLGPNPGVYATFQPGAACLTVGRCNITSDGGSVVLFGAFQAVLEKLQCEQDDTYAGDFNGMVILSGCLGCKVLNSSINNHGNTACMVLENGTDYCIVEKNVLITANSQAHVLIGPYSPDNAICQSNVCYPNGAVNYIDGTSPLWNF